jgi:hypothetical protein
MTSERIKEIQEETAYPQSVSVMLALNKVWNECEQGVYKDTISAYKECFELFIPTEKWDEATKFLSTYNNGLAKDLSNKEL